MINFTINFAVANLVVIKKSELFSKPFGYHQFRGREAGGNKRGGIIF